MVSPRVWRPRLRDTVNNEINQLSLTISAQVKSNKLQVVRAGESLTISHFTFDLFTSITLSRARLHCNPYTGRHHLYTGTSN